MWNTWTKMLWVKEIGHGKSSPPLLPHSDIHTGDPLPFLVVSRKAITERNWVCKTLFWPTTVVIIQFYQGKYNLILVNSKEVSQGSPWQPTLKYLWFWLFQLWGTRRLDYVFNSNTANLSSHKELAREQWHGRKWLSGVRSHSQFSVSWAVSCSLVDFSQGHLCFWRT